MPRAPRYLFQIIFLCLNLLWSCSGKTPYPVLITRNQASYDFDCQVEEIKVRPIGKHRYVAEGCYKREIYVCDAGLLTLESSIECKQQLSPLPTVENNSEE
ncbi:MAG: hypothetical protein AB8G05_26915 [Oligoflexales bacterium]